tara:strand:- start:156 stop:572 length:417 start_codon:yes stop_codon:yes gene_type:complete
MNIIELSNDFCQNYLACIRRASNILKVTHTQAICLQTIPFRGISQAELAKKLNIDISTLSRNLDKLIKLQLINKESSLSDKRSFNISLTENGQKLYNKFNAIISEELGKVYDMLELEERDQFETILNKINWQLELLNK